MYKEKILKIGEEIKEELIKIRRDIHAHPEIALKEIRTSNFIYEKLKALKLEVHKNIGVTGVVGILRGKYPGKTVLLRADMDCLKMEEETDLEYKSKNPSYMHACGHDAHVSWLLGAAMILSSFKDELKGNIKFVFQPAEEVVGGSLRMIEEGVLENPKVDIAFGAHVWPNIESGKIGIKYGPLMAAPDFFNITIIGKGGHGATPHKCVDPINIACQVYLALQTLVSRKLDAVDPAVISICTFNGGTSKNIIPNEVTLSGTVRTFNDEIRDYIPLKMEEMIKGITMANGGAYKFKFDKCYPPVINDSYAASIFEKSTKELFGDDSVVILDKPEMIGEDFSYFGQNIPSAFIAIGNYNSEKGTTEPLHSSKFNVDEDIIPKASMAFSYAALNSLDMF